MLPTHVGVTAGIRDLALAIAHAEGFGRPGAIPTRANNPGDLVIPGWSGAQLGAEGISVFPSESAGWDALYAQLQRIVDGRSHIYTVQTTIGEMARRWTATDVESWTTNVIAYLVAHGYSAVTAETPIGRIVWTA
jgi:hypothetical protein